MEGYELARCLFCETGKESRVIQTIHENRLGRAIFAHRIRYIKKNAAWTRVEAPLLPGYVFAYAERESSGADYQKIPHVIRVLKYEDGRDALAGGDLKFADWLWKLNGEIGVVKTVRVGDHVEVADAMFREMGATVLHVNRRQRKVYVSLDTQSVALHSWLAYEQLDGADEEP